MSLALISNITYDIHFKKIIQLITHDVCHYGDKEIDALKRHLMLSQC